jgi:hypothetical protein
LSTAWLSASGIALPSADQLQWMSSESVTKSITPEYFGTPAAPISNNSGRILFACSTRLCALTTADQTISLVSTSDFSTTSQVAWVTISGKRYAVAGVDGKLQLFLNI